MDEHKITDYNIRMVTSSNLVEILDDHLVRHNTKVLARLIYDLALEMTSMRIVRDMRNSVNRLVNCETANLNKTVSAAMKQVESIQL